MLKIVLPLLAVVSVASCSLSSAADDPGEVLDISLVPADLKVNVNAIAFNGTSLQVNIDGADTTPLLATYTRDSSLDVNGYLAFRMQEDALDRLFIALAKESADGAVRAITVADGGQFNYYFGGGVFERDGAFDRPTIGTGPGAGQVSYAGSYSAVTNVGLTGGPTFVGIAVPPDTDSSIIPGQPSRVSGDIFLNANFADNTVNGAIYNRLIVDTGFDLRTVILVPTAIAENGTFAGNAEFDVEEVIGTYGGIFGGTDANSVAGLVHLTQFEDDWDNEQEHGVFVLTQCGPNNTLPICDDVAPF